VFEKRVQRELQGKKERNRKRIEEEIKNITTKAQIWKFVNLGRKKARTVGENISMEEWERHFLELLEGERGTCEETGEKIRTEGDQEEELREEEIEKKKRKKKEKEKKRQGLMTSQEKHGCTATDGLKKDSRIYSRGYGKERGSRKNGGEVRNYRGITLL